MDSRASTIITIASVTVIGGFLAYAAYFDYKRRNDVQFRKQLRKEKKRVDKSIAQSKESLTASSSSPEVTDAALRDALEQIKKEGGPQTPEEKEAYFMSQVSMGEQLAIKGPDFHLASAMSFYRALRVYPSPVELIVIYQKTVPEPIFKMVMNMTNLDVKSRVEGYYEAFPPKVTNVAIETREGRKVAVVTKDISSGEIIYTEHPVVTVLDPDLQASGAHCAHCFRRIASSNSFELPADTDPLHSKFCSNDCLAANKSQSHSLLFTTESPLPEEMVTAPVSPDAIEARQKAQANFVLYIEKEGRAVPLLVARFIARQVAREINKMTSSGKTSDLKDEYTGADIEEYQLADHMERLRYLEVQSPAEGFRLLVDILQTALPGLEQFVTEERHATLLGKMAYNAIGVCFGGGRDDKPPSDTRPEDAEKTRTPYGTSRQVGSAFYTLSSYLSHSCIPSVRPCFSSETTEIHVIANRDLKRGDELSMAYVDVTQHPDESVVECRRRRRMELARGWRFACGCTRCAEEATAMTAEEKEAHVDVDVKDGSKAEASVEHFETEKADVE